MGWCACCATSGRCRASSGGGGGGWSASASTPFTRSQPRSRKAFPPCFVAVCGWVVCAKNWQLQEDTYNRASLRREECNFPLHARRGVNTLGGLAAAAKRKPTVAL